MSNADLTVRVGYAALVALALTLPFELQRPLFSIGPLAITNTELLLALTLLMALLHRLSSTHHSPLSTLHFPSGWLPLLALYVAALFVSALLAPTFQANALRAALRTLAGILLVPAVLILVRSHKAWWGVIVAVVAGGLVATAVGTAEVVAGYDFEWLLPWRTTPTVAGPFLRLAGPFDYANQAAMFIEATLPFLVALGIAAARSGRRLALIGLLIAFVLYAQAAVLTFSRATLGAIVLSHLLVAVWLIVRRSAAGRRVALWWGGAASVVLVLILANFLLSPIFRLRLQSQVDRDWYQAIIEVPTSLTMQADQTVIVPVSIINTGSLTWYHSGTNQFNLGMRWQLANTDLELSRHPRWPLDRNVAPGEAITLQVPLRAPIRGGQYRLVWDMVHENVTWFGAKNPTEASSQILVDGNVRLDGPLADSQVPATATTPLQFDAPIPGRRDLWAVALQLFRMHPLTGIGLDNFRLSYGRFFNPQLLPPGTAWNDTIHTNNWYLETLVSLGLPGSLPFFVWSGLLLFDLFRTLGTVQFRNVFFSQKSWSKRCGRSPTMPPLARSETGHSELFKNFQWFTLQKSWSTFTAIHVGQAAVASGLLSYFIHGLLDYFMLFNATALLFWLLIGLWLFGRNDVVHT